jgi:hypothetical protein
MADRKLYSLYIDLFENGHRVDIPDLSEDERTAICLEIEDLWTDQYLFDAHRNDFVVGLSPDEDMLYLVHRTGGHQAAFPADCGIREITVGAPKVNQQTLKLIGDRIPLRLAGYPGRRVEVMFSDV